MRAFNIDWDIDNDGYITPSEHDLLPPTELELPDDIQEDEIADWLSDTYGWCVNSFEIAY